MDNISNYMYNPVGGVGSDIKFVDKNETSSVAFEDFLNLMISQLQNQDFTNPVDDGEYLAQIAQFSMLQQMQEVTKNSQYSFASSLLGKVVSVQKTSETGNVQKDTGYVDKVNMSGDELTFYVNGSPYTMTNIVEIVDETYYLTEQLNKNEGE